MASKKVIAICQSKGEFVKSKDGTLQYSGGEAYAIDIDQNTQLTYFKKEVADMYNCGVDGMSIKYFLPGNKKTLISVSKDKDLARMVSFAGDANTVDVFISTDEGAAPIASDVHGSRSSRTTVSEAVTPVPPPVVADAVMTNDNDNDPVDMKTPNSTTLNRKKNSFDGNKHLKAAQQWENVITGVDQRFGSIEEFREALRRYSIAHGFAYRYKKNDSHRVIAKCKSEGCNWRIYAARLKTTQLICVKRMVDEHTCGGAALRPGCRAAQGWLGSMIKEKLKSSPNYRPKHIVDDIEREFGIQLNYSQAWRAKEVAKEQIQGSFKESYGQLPLFCNKIREINPGSIATVTTKEDSSFHRLFIAFHASITGFQQGCRPLIFLDSAPLNSKYQGEFLTAFSADGDDGAFPVAFAIVETESADDWQWFLEELKNALSLSGPVTFIADFQNGLKEVLAKVFSTSCHSYCLRYMAEKLNRDLKGHLSHEARRLMVNDFYAAAFAIHLEDFNRCINNIKAISSEAHDWIIKSETKQWANALFEGMRYNLLTSNFGQLFFGWVSTAGELPITQLIDVLRGKMMDLMYTRRTESNQWGTRLTPSKEEKLEKEISKAQSLEISQSHGSMFEVHSDSLHVVDINNWVCSCKGWQVTGLPCCHAIAVLRFIDRDPYDYCSKYFTVDCYHLAYAESIEHVPYIEKPVESEGSEQAVIVNPPPTRPPGRPKMKSAETVDIVKRQMQCSKCKGLGHNKKTCKGSKDAA